MNVTARLRQLPRLLLLTATTVLCLVFASLCYVVAPPSLAATPGTPRGPCALISKSRLASVLGVSHLEEHPSIGPRYPHERKGRVASGCLAEAWRGSKPATPKAQEEALASEAGAEFGINTFATDAQAPTEVQQKWVGAGGGYESQLRLAKASALFIFGIINHVHDVRRILFTLPRLGAERREGFQGELPANGLPHHIREATAFWADDSSHSILSLTLIEGIHKSTVKKKLERLARIVVPAFGT